MKKTAVVCLLKEDRPLFGIELWMQEVVRLPCEQQERE